MKTFQTFHLWAALLLAATSPLQAQTVVRVTADNVNLRAKPQLTAEVLAQVHYDEQLAAREIGEEWIEVATPAAVDLWISKDYVQQPDNVIGARRVNVRAGPSINYNIVDTLERGTPVEPRGELDGWLKIAPPPTTHLWIHRDYVEIPSAPAVAGAAPEAPPAEKPAPAETKASRKRKPKADTPPEAPAAIDTATAQPAAPDPALPTPIVSPSVPVRDPAGREIPAPPPANLKLIPLEGQGRLAEFEGELRAAPLINEAPTRYRVVRWQNNRWQILCHVYGEAAKFRSLQDKRVRVKGREYWIQGAAAPVLVPDQIQEVAGE
jgi:SH3-like domain-containing protein